MLRIAQHVSNGISEFMSALKQENNWLFYFGVCRKNCHTLLFYGKFRKQSKHCQEWFPFPIFRAWASKVVIASGSCDDQPGRRKASKYECESGILGNPGCDSTHLYTMMIGQLLVKKKETDLEALGSETLFGHDNNQVKHQTQLSLDDNHV